MADHYFHAFLSEIKDYGYSVSYEEYDAGKMTGTPVVDSKVYIIGYLNHEKTPLELPEKNNYRFCTIEEICQSENRIDEWYMKINDRQIHAEQKNSNSFLCWKTNKYVDMDTVSWNTVKIPLVRINGVTRKITHREIARLKSFPDNFCLDVSNKAWLYKKLMYSSNMKVIQCFVKTINSYMDGTTVVRNSQIDRAKYFEELLCRYISNKNLDFEREYRENEYIWDFVINKQNERIYIETKFYASNVGIDGKVLIVCQKISGFSKYMAGTYVLMVGNVVKDETKDKCLKEYNIFVWDVRNLLWIMDEFIDLKNEFVSLLSYTISDIEPKNPENNFFELNVKKDNIVVELSEKLKKISPGKENFLQYEEVSTEILKYILGDYLTLWERQKKSNNDLYRFDLCCKIKHGDLPDFFDTIKNFFNTKYIVFEFKNYEKPITQKEIYTTEKYLYQKALRSVAIIISRKGADNHAMTAARGCLRENGKLILCLSDDDLLELIEIKYKGEQSAAERLSDRLDMMLINLEK